VREALTATKLYAALMGGFVFFSLAGFFLTQSGFTLSVTLTNGFEVSLTGASLTSLSFGFGGSGVLDLTLGLPSGPRP